MKFRISFITLLALGSVVHCSKVVIKSKAGEISKGTFALLKKVYYEGQFAEEEIEAKRNVAIANDIVDLETQGALATKKGLEKDESYREYRHRQLRARHGRTAITYWREKYKDKFNWEMVFPSEKMIFKGKDFVKDFFSTIKTGGNIEQVIVAQFEEKPLTISDLRTIMTVSESAELQYQTEIPLLSTVKELLKFWLEKKIHDRYCKMIFADEKELIRYDHARVAQLFLKVKYAKAGKGIYPGAMDKIYFKPMELYDHFFKMQKTLADVLEVKAVFTVVEDENRAEELIAKYDKGADFFELAKKYAVSEKFVTTAKPFLIQGYDKKRRIDDQEKRDYYHKLILDMASRDVLKPDPYLGRDGIVVVRILDVKRDLAKVKYEEVNWKVEHDLQIKMLNQLFVEDLKDMQKYLDFKINTSLLEKLP